MAELFSNPEAEAPAWTLVHTEEFLTAYPLPVNFCWPDDHGLNRPVLPVKRTHKGYGFWLRTTPYWPGLFELCHRIIAAAPTDVEMTPEWLAAELEKQRPKRTDVPLPSISSDNLP